MASTPTKDLGLVIAVFIGLGFLWVLMGRPVANQNILNSPFLSSSFVPVASNFSDGQSGSHSAQTISSPTVDDGGVIIINNVTYLKSPWYGQVKLGRGNASSAYQPTDEYINLSVSNKNQDSIAISNWFLENGRRFKAYDIGSGNVTQGVSARIKIPQGVEVLLGQSNQSLHAIVLKPGDKAVVTTGGIRNGGANAEVKVNSSFKTNKCTGYIEDLPGVNFSPRLKTNCPDPEKVPGVSSLPTKCFDFIRRLSNCHTPDTADYLDSNRELVRGAIDKVTGLSSYCRDWVVSHYSYQACLNRSVTDKDFDGKEWRIFLNQPFELWDKSREVITLYDAQGRLVDQLSY